MHICTKGLNLHGASAALSEQPIHWRNGIRGPILAPNGVPSSRAPDLFSISDSDSVAFTIQKLYKLWVVPGEVVVKVLS